MALISFTVPCYNSAGYMKNCINSLLTGGEDVEIIIVDDGSTDETAKIADDYHLKYPNIIKVVHKANGGHGSGINSGLKAASGLYFKVVDSDDWVNEEALLSLLSTIKTHIRQKKNVDLYITNFVYERSTDNSQYVSSYEKYFPVDEHFTWEHSKSMHLWHMLLMHAITTKTELLRQSGIVLPEHTFYVDNLFAYYPLPYINNIYYANIDLYRYYIGRSDQSVTIDNMVARYRQQITVTSRMMDAYSYETISELEKKLQKQMYHFLKSVIINTYFFSTQKNEQARKDDINAMWSSLKESDPELYHKLRRIPIIHFLAFAPWRMTGFMSLHGYKALTKIAKLGI